MERRYLNIIIRITVFVTLAQVLGLPLESFAKDDKSTHFIKVSSSPTIDAQTGEQQQFTVTTAEVGASSEAKNRDINFTLRDLADAKRKNPSLDINVASISPDGVLDPKDIAQVIATKSGVKLVNAKVPGAKEPNSTHVFTIIRHMINGIPHAWTFVRTKGLSMTSAIRQGVTIGSLGLNLSKKNPILNDSPFFAAIEKRYNSLREKLIVISKERMDKFPDLDGKGLNPKLKWTVYWLKQEASYILLTNFTMKIFRISAQALPPNIFQPAAMANFAANLMLEVALGRDDGKITYLAKLKPGTQEKLKEAFKTALAIFGSLPMTSESTFVAYSALFGVAWVELYRQQIIREHEIERNLTAETSSSAPTQLLCAEKAANLHRNQSTFAIGN